MRDWVYDASDKMDKKNFALFLIGCWNPWRRRNESVFDGKTRSNELVVEGCVNTLTECTKDPKAKKDKPLKPTTRWRPPEMGKLKLNTDAMIRAEGGTGFGTDQTDASMDACVAEAHAILRGIQLDRPRWNLTTWWLSNALESRKNALLILRPSLVIASSFLDPSLLFLGLIRCGKGIPSPMFLLD